MNINCLGKKDRGSSENLCLTHIRNHVLSPAGNRPCLSQLCPRPPLALFFGGDRPSLFSSSSPPLLFILSPSSPACLKEEYSKKKGDAAAIAEDKKKKKKKGVGKKKSKDAGGSDGGSQEGEAARKTVNKKGKAVSPEKEREGVSSDEDIQLKVALPGKNTEL